MMADGSSARTCTIFNLYKPPTIIPGNAAKAGKWIDHVRKVYPTTPSTSSRWLAHRVQRPGREDQPRHRHGRREGIGKDTILEPVKHAVGPWNLKEVSPRRSWEGLTAI